MATEKKEFQGPVDPDSGHEMGLREMLAALWRRRWYLFGFILLSVGLGVAYLAQLEPMYQVEARVLVQQQPNSPLDQRTREARPDPEFLATQAEIIRSPVVVESAVRDWRLSAPPGSELDCAEFILKSLNVEPILGTAVLSVVFRSPDAESAVRTVEALLASYREYTRRSERENHIEVLSLLTQDEKRLRGELQELTTKYTALRKDGPLVGQGKDAGSIHNLFLTNLGQAVTEVTSRRLALAGQLQLLTQKLTGNAKAGDAATINPVKYSVASLDGGAGRVEASAASMPAGGEAAGANATTSLAQLPSGLGDLKNGSLGNMIAIQGELFRAQAHEKELTQAYGPKHPDVVAARAEVAAWQSRLQEMLDAIPVALEGDLKAAEAQEQQLTDLYQKEVQKAKAADSYLLQEQQALEEIERVRTVYGTIVAQLRQWQLADQALAEGRSRVLVDVLEAPAAKRQVPLPPALLLVVCGMVGLIGGFGVVSIVERTDTRIHSLDDVRNRLNFPILGRIPVLAKSGRPVPSFLHGRVVCQMPESAGAEAFRSLRTRLGTILKPGSGAVLEMASPASGEGKTTVTANLAFSFAQLGKSVVVVDADLRKGNLHDVFEVPVGKGLTTVIREGIPAKAAIERSPLGPVDVLSRGPAVEQPGELLAQVEFGKVLECLSREYDIVLVDTPPLLEAADASAIAAKTDGVILSLAIERSTVPDALSACELLDSLGAKVLGIVCNRTSSSKRYYYGNDARRGEPSRAGDDRVPAATAS